VTRPTTAAEADVRRIALSLPETSEEPDRFAFSVNNKGKRKGIVWVWLERVHPKKPRVPKPGVVAIRVAGEAMKQALLASDTKKFFTEPHYNGYPAILVRLSAIKKDELEELITQAWRCQAPKALVKQLDARAVATDAAPPKARPRRDARGSRHDG
jgi:hypothetical protein